MATQPARPHVMGKSAKFYKKPTLREKEGSRKASSVSSNNPLSKTILAERAKAETRARAVALQSEALRSGVEKGKKKTGGAKRKAKPSLKDGNGEDSKIRTPRDAGIDYVAQWEGRRR